MYLRDFSNFGISDVRKSKKKLVRNKSVTPMKTLNIIVCLISARSALLIDLHLWFTNVVEEAESGTS